MSEVDDWKVVANEIFAAFGDVVKDVIVTTILQGTVFSTAISGYTTTTASITTVGVWAPSSHRKYFTQEQLVNSKGILMLRGSDFTILPNPGDSLVVSSTTYRVEAATWDEAETGSYVLVSVSK